MDITTFASLLTDTTEAAPTAEFLRFEASIRAALPTDYRNFLSRVNGGFLPSGRFPNLLAFRDDRVAAVAHVFGFREEPHFSLFWHIENLGVPLPDDLIGIMDDGNGNLICLGVSGERYGKMYIRDGAEIYFLTNSFSEFIARLRYWRELFPEDSNVDECESPNERA